MKTTGDGTELPFILGVFLKTFVAIRISGKIEIHFHMVPKLFTIGKLAIGAQPVLSNPQQAAYVETRHALSLHR